MGRSGHRLTSGLRTRASFASSALLTQHVGIGRSVPNARWPEISNPVSAIGFEDGGVDRDCRLFPSSGDHMVTNRCCDFSILGKDQHYQDDKARIGGIEYPLLGHRAGALGFFTGSARSRPRVPSAGRRIECLKRGLWGA